MKANRVLNRKKENENKRKEDATEAISIMTNKSVQINFDYSKLQDINEEEKAKLMEIEKEIIFEGKKLGTIAVEIGKKLLEAKPVECKPKLVINNPTKDFYEFKVEDFEIKDYDYNKEVKIGKIPVAE